MRLRDSVRRCRDRLGASRRHPDSLLRCKCLLGTCKRFSVCDAVRKSPRPASHPQETSRQSSTVPGPSKQLQETSRRCQNSPRPSGHLQENPITAFYGAKTVWSPAGYSKTVCDGANACRGLSEVFDGARQSLRPDRHLQETPRQSATVLRRCKNTYRRFPDCLRWCQTVSQTGGAHARDSHTFCDVLRPSRQLKETPRQSVTVPDSLSLRRRLL
ncbi:hypothetical protein DPMN_079097 [Dreissena polymorpha]|uniref:Uncharacterized protein n=1 Tax=Dreissena polymorpha TaxID=45954 RepID=A0A9D4BSP9_DREPO|nr:hypothetical protein DPMN_079097 [Dreissena polymorpha]